MTFMASNNNLDALNKSYEEAMLKLNDKAWSQFKQNMDTMREKNPQTEDEQISTRPGGM